MTRVKATYPDWVMKHKKKGYYINFVKPDKYYVYKAHSERDKETGKINRVCDGYVGRITEKDGLILSKKNRPPEDHSTHSLEYGFSYVIRKSTEGIQRGLKQTYQKDGDLVYVLSILNYMYGFYDQEVFVSSYLSVLFSKVRYPSSLSSSLSAGIERGTRMISDRMNHAFPDNTAVLKAYASCVSAIYKDKTYSLPVIPAHTEEFLKRYGIRLGDDINAKNRQEIKGTENFSS